MENLLVLFNKIQQISPLPLLSQEVVIVQNQGMQHWLNLSLAQQRGIAMNLSYALPSQYLWQLVRTLVSEQEVPDQSPYSREVLVWRIDSLLQQPEVLQDCIFTPVCQYWQSDNSAKAALKRYQLSLQLADLFEQYLVFRPEWLAKWQRGNWLLDELEAGAKTNGVAWQGRLWQLLVQREPYDPVALLAAAKKSMGRLKQLLPERISFFGINALPPMWLDFIASLSEHIDVHFFHLNPCFAYWGDILSEKQAASQLSHWSEQDELSALVGNPLLANLGQQGREFLSLLQQVSTVNIDVFEQSSSLLSSEQDKASVLHCIQNDILSLGDAREQPKQRHDDSITVTSAHSALREVQGLHDWLLHQFNRDPALTPKDVLVMCPQVENYAPYIEAVFSRGWRDIGDSVPPLPCSIADRISKDADPIVAAMLELLTLPDSRFQVSQLMAFLRLPAMQLKFDISLEDIEQLEHWLQRAAIHWGLDAEHKRALLHEPQSNDSFTWQQGISRLLLGFAWGEQDEIYQQLLLLPDVEGEGTVLLGKFLAILESLQHYAGFLARPRLASQWARLLQEMVAELFADNGEAAFVIIEQAIAALAEYPQQAGYPHKLSLAVVKEFLHHHFSQPDPGRQFLIGQVTFCSLIPMRSIPFKVIAVLGLNDGEFPRQRRQNAFDLMQHTPPRLGDRSRRGDDRYLFLEALICARQALYLSYQGRNIKNNGQRQPSPVLRELMAYLELGYGWSLLDEGRHLRCLPMQPFSVRNYQGTYASFDQHWLALQQRSPDDEAPLQLANEQGSDEIISLELEQLLSFFAHPAKAFARQRLGLFLDAESHSLSDVEPFADSTLDIYLLKQQLLQAQLSDDAQQQQQVLDKAKLSGSFPDSPLTAQNLDNWCRQSQEFADEILARALAPVSTVPVRLQLAIQLAGQLRRVEISASLPVAGQQCVHYRSSNAKGNDLLRLYLLRLFSMVTQQQLANQSSEHRATVAALVGSSGCFFNSKSQKVQSYGFSHIAQPDERLTGLLQCYFEGLQRPLLLNASLGQQCFGGKAEMTEADFQHWWTDNRHSAAFGDDPYIHYFWRQCPPLAEHIAMLQGTYQPLFDALQEVK